MMDLFAGLAHGFATLLSPLVLAAGVLGLFAGMIAGFLPGLSPAGGLALASALAGWVIVTFGEQSPVVFVVAFAYGTLYGRALAAINDDAMAGSVLPAPSNWRPLIFLILVGIATAVAATALIVASQPLTLSLGPAELCAVVIFILLAGAAFSVSSVAGAPAMIVLGLLLRLVGADIETGLPRLTFGLSALEDGFNLLEVALGFFVIANVIDDLLRPAAGRGIDAPVPNSRVRRLWPTALLAFLAGFLPTNGETFATTAGARRARCRSDWLDPASHSGTASILRAAMLSDIRLSASLIPLFLWFAPVDAIVVLLRGVANGQAQITNTVVDRTPIGWLMGATLALAHVVPIALVAGLAKVRWRPMRIDPRIVGPAVAITVCSLVWWVYDFDRSVVIGVLAFGLLGYALIRAGLDRHLMFIAFAVGAILEENVRRTLLIARGDPLVYLERPISAIFLIAGVLIFVVVRALRGRNSARPT